MGDDDRHADGRELDRGRRGRSPSERGRRSRSSRRETHRDGSRGGSRGSPPRDEHRRSRRRSPSDDRRRRSRSRSRSRSRGRGGSDRRRRHTPSPPPRNRRSSRSRSRSPQRRRHYSRSRSPPRRDRGGGFDQQRQYDQRQYSQREHPAHFRNEGPDRHPSSSGGFDRDRGGSDRQPWGRGPPGGGGMGGPPASEEPPEVGTIHQGTVVSVRPFGVFVELPGFRKQGLVHNTQVSEEMHFSREDDDESKVKALEFFLPKGEKVWVKVVEVRREEGRDARVGCSMKAVDQETGADLDPNNTLAGPHARGGGGGGRGGPPDSDEPPELNSVQPGAVQSVRPFGVFVKMDGFRKYGLVHVSQISDHMDLSREDTDEEKVAAISEVLGVGERVFVKVVEVRQDERGPKIGCSIKLVNQKDGTDLDPHGLKFRPRGEGGGPHGREAIGAHVAETHGDKVEWGHLSADVVQYGGGGRQYEILADESPPTHQAAAGAGGMRGRPAGPGGGSAGGSGHPGSSGGAEMLPPRGRGRGSVLPAWMTGGGGGAPGSSGPEPPREPSGGGGAKITSVEDALAILEQLGKGKKHKHKDKSKKKRKKERKEKKKKHKKERRKGGGSSSSSGSESE